MIARFKEIINQAFDYKTALEREKLNQDNIDQLREKIKNSPVIPKAIADKQLLPFLAACKNDVEKSAVLIENFYKIKKSAPEFFASRDVDSEEIQNCLKNQNYVALPLTPDNHMLIFHSLKNYDPNSYDFDAAAKTYIMTSEAYSYEHGPLPGIVYLFDLKGLSFRFLFKPSISSMRKGIRFMEEGMPFHIKAIHVFNTVPFFDLIVAIVKPLINSELLNKLHLHHSNMDYEKFYEEHVPRTHLPQEYGGVLGTVEELHQKSTVKLLQLKEYFLLEEMQTNLEFEEYEEEVKYLK